MSRTTMYQVRSFAGESRLIEMDSGVCESDDSADRVIANAKSRGVADHIEVLNEAGECCEHWVKRDGGYHRFW